MFDANKIFLQLNELTTDLIQTGLCDDQNFPYIVKLSEDRKKVCIGDLNTNIFLKNVPYRDGAMILLEYTFQKDKIIHHRLSFFPSPDLLEYQQNEEIYLEDEIYADILDKQIVTVPLRFDYENKEEIAEPIEHPISHLTIGQYENCRIPVSSAVPPSLFIEFIIRNFYHTAYHKYCNMIRKFKNEFAESIYKEEKSLVYMGIPPY